MSLKRQGTLVLQSVLPAGQDLAVCPAPCLRDKPRPPAIINILHTEFALWPYENPCRQKLLELLQSHVNARTPIRSMLPWPPY